ncbi:adenine phosphoribosyltransferase [Lawsonella clevelandensis]|uniref:Adenine phosphoribosyltransferase n=1 Tax=Lawsonella clevelandensis TaxID=1528099 RepID=A0A0M4M7E8_9ACTN|nr:adenine phosphoribosyltransferase [Lawsonella clevelandensis]ALE18463.1 adenine phosphoribosyltransferase [Lawsonella clevelandensis]ALE34117.1 adenine phosphoribosyltransferase [Lawsonella clevelandensis]MDU7193565.1 adenine phosphoribosyltransferase [Lawsonella clevelandensis]VHN99609.1 Adenine phosphoribosyltransferase [Lawsonella clevelandensis]
MGTTLAQRIQDNIRWVADFPEEGVHFADLTPVLADPQIFNGIMRQMSDWAGEVDIIAGLDARGFLISAGVAVLKDVGVLALRKAGKLPSPVHHVDYGLEYGEAALEIPAEGLDITGKRIFIVDDVMATGGTSQAALELIEQAGGVVTGFATILELTELNGRSKLADLPVFSITTA